MKRTRWLTGAVLVLVACGGSDEGKGCAAGFGSNGEIGEATFDYLCGDDDQICPDQTAPVESKLPNIAVGGAFNLALRSRNDAGLPPTTLVPAIGLVFEKRPKGFVAKAQGLEPVLALDPTGTRVVDLVHFEVLAPSTLAIEGTNTSPIAVGGERKIVAQIRGATPDGGAPVRLAGVAATFSVGDSAIGEIVTQRNGVATIVGRRSGATVVTATFGSLTATTTLRVSTDAGIADGGLDATDANGEKGGSDATID